MPSFHIVPLLDMNPQILITPLSHPSLGENINGPSLIRVPDWVENPLGKYYLYFANHYGRFIRLAVGNSPSGPFRVHPPGVLPLDNTPFDRHIASPDVHVDDTSRQIFLLYHGLGCRFSHNLDHPQLTACATSADGLDFKSTDHYLGPPYLRFFHNGREWIGMAGDGSRCLYRGNSLQAVFEQGRPLPILDEPYEDDDPDMDRYRMRHCAWDIHGGQTYLYYSNVGDTPERIKRTRLVMEGDWTNWYGESFEEVHEPRSEAEGTDCPLVRSHHGGASKRVRELRDPFVYRENERVWLYYSMAGESGIAVMAL